MGYNQNNAGIHLVPRGYKGSFDSFQPYDRYGAIIAENNLSKENREKKRLRKKECTQKEKAGRTGSGRQKTEKVPE